MQTLTFKSHVGADGILHLDIPIGLQNQSLEIVLVVQAVPTIAPDLAEDSSNTQIDIIETMDDLFAKTAGAWEGPALVREPQGEYEERRWDLME